MIKSQMGLSQNDLHEKPLVIIITKFDTWSSLIGEDRIPDPWEKNPNGGPDGVSIERVQEISDRVRQVLVEHASELVSVAEGFCREVIYLPVSATGCSPQVDDETDQPIGIAPKDINPMWVEVPLLYVLARFTEGVVPQKITRDQANVESTIDDPDEESQISSASNRPPYPPELPELPDIL